MSERRLILLTTTWPYDSGETFLSEEAGYLSQAYGSVDVFPLSASSLQMRKVPSNFTIHAPAIRGTLKNKALLLWKGVFSTAPLGFALKAFFCEKGYRRSRLWNFFTALLTFRAAYPSIARFGVTAADTVYSYWGDKWSLALPFIKRKAECKTVARFHGSDLYEEAKGGYAPFRSMLFGGIDCAFAISEYGVKYIKERYGNMYTGKVELARLGVASAGENPEQTSGTFSIVSCSNAIPLKRLEFIAESLKQISFPIKWTHIGDGPTLANVKKIAEGLPQNVTVRLTGRMDNAQVRELYRTEHFDLFINVSSTEGVPVSIMEALSAGIPVIATNVGGTAEIVDEQVGILLPSNITPAKIAKSINNIRGNCKKLLTLRHNSEKRWNERCNSETNYRNFITILKSI
ncbi:MAG: glycosyltransferase [Paludibacteraceae bacterium]|nr:glycosyltransferase [Paludibacteraceae bacterium]